MTSYPFIGAEIFQAVSLYQLVATLLTYCVLRIYLFLKARQRRYKLFKHHGIPGPKANIFTGNFDLYRQDAAYHKGDDYCRAKFGKTFGVFFGDDPVLVSVDLNLLKHVFLDKVDSFRGRVNLIIKSPLSESVLFAPYHRWKAMRRLISPSFSKYKTRCPESMQFIELSVGLTLDHLDRKLASASEHNDKLGRTTIELDILSLMKATSLHIISQMAFDLDGVEVSENNEHVKGLDKFMSDSGNVCIDLAAKFPFLKPGLEYVAMNFQYSSALDLINKSVNKAIDKRLGQLNMKSADGYQLSASESRLIDQLIKLHHEGKLTRSEVIANCQGILVAGYDTTSTTLTYIFWAIAKHTQVQETLREQLMMYGTDSRYLEQVIFETMRLYPTSINFTARLATENVKFDKMSIPKGTKVIFNNWLVHRDQDIWPNPLEFDPNRFGPENKAIHPCAFAPFGLGVRKCLGYELALLEMKVQICEILLRYKIHLIGPLDLDVVTYCQTLTKPREKVLLEVERL